MLFKIISVEDINDKKYGACTKISANKKPQGVKSILPYSMVSDKYGVDTYKFLVNSDPELVKAARKAKLTQKYLDIVMEAFREDYDDSMESMAIDAFNRYTNIEENDYQEEESEVSCFDDNPEDIFEDYRQIMFLDNNPNGQIKEYNVMVTSTMNGYVCGNYNFSILADSRDDALSQIINNISRAEGRNVTIKDFLSCVISPVR